MLNIGLEQQQQIRGADGTLLWSGAQVLGTTYIAASSEASNAFAMGEAALWDPATVAIGFIPRQETTAAGATPAADLPGDLVLGMKRTPASAGTAVGFLGVVQEPVGVGGSGLIAGPGSLTTVLTTTATIAVGTVLASSATAGLCAAAATKSATVPAYGTVLGICLKTNTAGATGTGDTSWTGIMVQPG
jgi:hypothetical protein